MEKLVSHDIQAGSQPKKSGTLWGDLWHQLVYGSASHICLQSWTPFGPPLTPHQKVHTFWIPAEPDTFHFQMI